jgi:hypothetical protein
MSSIELTQVYALFTVLKCNLGFVFRCFFHYHFHATCFGNSLPSSGVVPLTISLQFIVRIDVKLKYKRIKWVYNSLYKFWGFPNVKIISYTGSSQIGDRRIAAVMCVVVYLILALRCYVIWMTVNNAYTCDINSATGCWNITYQLNWIINWRVKAQERDGWRKFVEQAKTHTGL